MVIHTKLNLSLSLPKMESITILTSTLSRASCVSLGYVDYVHVCYGRREQYI